MCILNIALIQTSGGVALHAVAIFRTFTNRGVEHTVFFLFFFFCRSLLTRVFPDWVLIHGCIS